MVVVVVLFFVFESCEMMILRRVGGGGDSPAGSTGHIIPRKANKGPVVLGDKDTRHRGGRWAKPNLLWECGVRGGPEGCQFSASTGRCVCVLESPRSLRLSRLEQNDQETSCGIKSASMREVV